MTHDAPANPGPGDEAARQRLFDLRQALLKLHKTLIESERIGYECTFGSIGSPGDFLRLLMQDPWFAWLHPLSELIVLIDETLDGKEPVTDLTADGLVKHARTLLTPAEHGNGFPIHYFEALQRDPDVVMAHADALAVVH